MVRRGGAARGGVHTLGGFGARLLTEHWARSLLNGAGVVLGVALFTGALITTDSTAQGIDAFLADTTGDADVVASAPGGTVSSLMRPRGGGLPAGSLGRLRALPDVEAADPAFALPTVIEGPEGRTQQRINFSSAAALIGLEQEAGSAFPIAAERGRLPVPGADEVVLPERLMDSIGALVGGTITAAASDGAHELRVVGVLEPRGLGRLDRIGVTSLATARRIGDEPDGVSQVAVQLRPGVDATRWLDEKADAVPGVSMVASEDALGPVRGQVQALAASLLVVGAGVLFTAGFLIYLTLSLSVAERTRLYGTVHALGATPRQVRRLVVAEALVIGLLGSVIGSGLGLGIAMVLRWATARLLALIGSGDLVIRPSTVAAGIAMGVVTTVASALGPARRAARVDAIDAIRTTVDPPPERDRWRRGLVLVVIGGALLAVGTSTTVLGAAVILVLLGSIWLVPPLIGPIASLLGRGTAKASRGVGRVAVEHLVAERSRSAYTLALVMLVMAMAIAGAAIHVSFTTSIDRQNDAEFAGGLTLFAASTFPDAMLEEVARQPGVAAVTPRGNGTSAVVGPGPRRDVIIRTLDPDTFFDVSRFRFETGDADDVRAGFSRGRSVVVPKATAHHLGVGVGDELLLDTAQGPVPFGIVATVELSNIPAVLLVSDQDGRSLFSIAGDNELQIRLAPGADASAVGADLERALADRGAFLAVTTEALKADTRAQIGAGINGFFVLILLAGVVGMFGLANTMVVSVTTRLREIGVLRAVGARRAQVRRMVMIEAVTLVLVAVVLAVPLGIALSRPLLQAVQATLVDTTVDYEFPLAVVPVLGAAGLVVAVLASLWPVRRAAATDIDVALRYE